MNPAKLPPRPVRPARLPVRVRRRFPAALGRLALLAASMLIALAACADEVQVAVAANFAGPMEQIAAGFARDTGNQVQVAVGSTGKFYAQIKNGAPFEILLAADAATPKRLEDEGMTVVGQRFTYAIGQLVLYSAQVGLVDGQGAVLRAGNFHYLAIANPKTAPYGAAAVEALQALGLWEGLQVKIVQGDSIAQAYEFIATGNAELGFIALSQLHSASGSTPGSSWRVPANLYRPIRQDAVLLKKGEGRPAALALLAYLRGEKARAVLSAYGYER
jgi:molybdate transport system substrate-binding protein